jgi:transcriptional regulator with XRE-family HTH domain
MNFAETLKRNLTKRSMTPLRLAVALEEQGLDVSTCAITRWLSGRNEPRLSAFKGICVALQTTPNDLLGFDARNAS